MFPVEVEMEVRLLFSYKTSDIHFNQHALFRCRSFEDKAATVERRRWRNFDWQAGATRRLGVQQPTTSVDSSPKDSNVAPISSSRHQLQNHTASASMLSSVCTIL